ncbi:MAG: hypothetical protein BWY28_02110 [bacterium ADurb.Bin236]|nr:MAG: hypothetical protein BWY28_02110 [bacterium ADurb.Bin236]HPN95268.1 hypothetical protein [bacterium]
MKKTILALKAFAALAAVLACLACAPRAFADGEPELDVFVAMATTEQLEAGFVIEAGGMPVYVKAERKPPSWESLVVPVPGGGQKLKVVQVPPRAATGEEREEARAIILPILIEDKALARGVTLHLTTPEGGSASIPIPPRKVFISIPFIIPVTEAVHPDFGDRDRNIILQIVPKITKKAQVDVDNTAADGIVADIKYEGIAYLKLKDILNRTNRRDMDGTFFVGKERDNRWTFITENLFERFDERNVGVQKNQIIGSGLKSLWRVDQLNNMNKTKYGANIRREGRFGYAQIGNVDRKVKDRAHFEMGYGDERLMLVGRLEGLEVVNPSSRLGVAMKVEKEGFQLRTSGGDDRRFFEGRFGTLKVQDFDDEGEIDDYFNFDFTYTTALGGDAKRWRPRKKWLVSGDASMRFWGRGSSSWLEGEFRVDATYKRDWAAILRFNNDFARITGRAENPLWESLFISFMRNRDYFNRDDRLAKFGLDSIFVDLDYSRQGKGANYGRRIRYGFSRNVIIYKYDFPMEFYFETVKSRVYRPGAGISIRRYL